MLKKPLTITLINTTLSIAIIVLSFYTIFWHKQNYSLYKTAKKLQRQNQKITALNKQLFTEYATQISAEVMQDKIVKTLDMKRVKTINTLKL